MSKTYIADLNGAWELRLGEQAACAPMTPGELDASDWPAIPAAVPGNVELDLVSAGRLPAKLYSGDNIYLLRPFESYRWFYRRSFVTPQLPEGWRAVLVFDGIDCLAEVFVNGQSVGSADNMFIEHEFDVTSALRREGDNDLVVRIDSAVLAGLQHRPDIIEQAGEGNWESLAIRKAPHMYGWDILPRIVSAGLWRGVRLEARPPVRLAEPYWTTLRIDHASRSAELFVDWHVFADRCTNGLNVRVRLCDGERVIGEMVQPVLSGAHGRVKLRVKDVEFWWPRGSGESRLYSGEVLLESADGEVMDRRTTAVGIRTVELRRTDVTDRYEGEFVFIINGRKVFCRGTNHVPLDAIHSRDMMHVPAVMEMLEELNCNMIRCWGGNVYESDSFFDECDRRGIMVWQDFAMACAIYPQTDEFAKVIGKEAEAVVRRLRNHPSLVLWAGNNEIDQAYSWGDLNVDPNSDIHSRKLLPEVVRRLDPFRPYLPSSPYFSPEYVRRGRQMRYAPEDHLWGPRDDFKGSFYGSSRAHFVSEIGYHGCPDVDTMHELLGPGCRWPWKDNDAWLTHCVRPQRELDRYNYRIPLMAKQIAVLFDQEPQTLEQFVFASQASQAEALKSFIERWRIGKWRRTGMLWWNLRDGWPLISDAVVDYFGRRKLAYGYIKASQADLCVCIAEPDAGQHRVMAVSDLQTDEQLHLVISDLDSGAVLLERDAVVRADASMAIGKVAPSERPAMWHIRWSSGRGEGQNWYLAGPRPFDLSRYRAWVERLRTLGALCV